MAGMNIGVRLSETEVAVDVDTTEKVSSQRCNKDCHTATRR
jgi:hypothetical protein